MDGSPMEKLNFMMNNFTDVYFDNITGIDDLGSFDGNVISGLGLEDNTGGSLSGLDGEVKNGYLYLTIMPKPAHRQSAGDIRQAKDKNEVIEKVFLYKKLYTARSRNKIIGSVSIPFSQEVKCYYSQGSHKTNNYSDLIFDMPQLIQPDPSFDSIKTLGFITNIMSIFENTAPFLLGNVAMESGSIDPQYPPREWTYIGSNQKYKNQKLQNGNLPQDLLGMATQGKTKPSMLAELVSGYDRMATDFATRFPGLTLSASGYRTYERQKTLKIEKPGLAAKPGTSNHGWGQAIDIHFYNSAGEYKKLLYSTDQYKWLTSNGKLYGWHNPAWALQGAKQRGVRGAKEEPWHWESLDLKFRRG